MDGLHLPCILILLVCFLCMTSCNAVAIGDSCSDDVDCTYSKSKCVGGTCDCVDTHYRGGSICQQKSILGEVCIDGQPANQCSVTNTECIAETTGGSSYKCLCMVNYYRDSQTCKPLTNLRVLNPDVPDSTTGETYFLVTWTNPSTVSFINGYHVILTALSITENAISIDKSKTNYNVTNRIPGRKYTITIRSLETASRPVTQTTDVTITDGTRPTVPGAITQSVFNGPTIGLTWTINGDVEHFSGTINDTTANPSTFNLTAVNRQPPILTVSNLRHGERYTFTVRSHSNGFTSDPYIQTIRTTPTTPTPPTSFACTTDQIFDRSMTLTWKEPIPPNGDIQYYIILDKTRTKQIQTSGSVEEQLVDQLLPENYYVFTMKTVNDAQSGTIGESGQLVCQTKTALASPPQNVDSLSVTSRSITVQWRNPAVLAGVILAYRLTVRNITDDNQEVCVQEIILQCNDCGLTQNLGYVGDCVFNILINKTPAQIANETISYLVQNLFPHVKYRIRIQTFNAKGDGNFADIINTTLQEEFLHIMSDKKAAIQAEIGHGKIEEEDVHVIPEDLLPHAELLLTIDIQAKAKKYFTSDAWKTVESTLTILEDLHLRKIKNKEFPCIVSMDKGKGKSSLQAPSEPNDVHCEVQNNPERDWISIAKQNEHKLQQFIDNHKPSKSLPSIGERIETVTNYEDHTKFLTEEQRTKITNFLCSKFNKLRIPTAKITYLLHDTISYLVNDFKFKDFQFKDTNDPRMEETTCLENEKAEVKLTQIRMPAKMRIKGRPKGSGQTIIGLAKKSTANTRKQKPKPFFKRCNKEKEKAILEWIVGSDLTKEACTNGKILEEKDVQKECLPGACVDSYVDMELVKHFFSSDGWTKVDMLLEKKRKHIDYNCDICLKSIDVGIVNVVCDSCLNVYHLPCVGLKSIPKSKHWFCNKCK